LAEDDLVESKRSCLFYIIYVFITLLTKLLIFYLPSCCSFCRPLSISFISN